MRPGPGHWLPSLSTAGVFPTRKTIDSPIYCPSCSAVVRKNRGRIPNATHFGSVRLDEPLVGGALLECEACALVFRHPRPSKARLDDLYRRQPLSKWVSGTIYRTDHALARAVITQRLLEGGAILDVGCFDGTFLSSLPNRFERFGIEINPAAATRSRELGVHIIGTDFASLADANRHFDAITAVDVIEHTYDPRAFMVAAAANLRPGGLLLLLTGNADAWTWRIMGGAYWYCALPEHLTFIRPKWLEANAAQAGLSIVDVKHFAYQGRSPRRLARQLAMNIVYRLAPHALALLRERSARAAGIELDRVDALLPPDLWHARDHVLAVLRRERS